MAEFAMGGSRTRRITRRRWFPAGASLLFHALLLGAAYQFGSYTVTAAGNRDRIERSERRADAMETERRVQDMAKIAELMKRSAGDAAPVGTPKPGGTPLEQARALAETIAETERHIKAAELAKVLRISMEEALARVPRQPLPPALAGQPTPDALNKAVRELEFQAQAALARRHAELVRSREGTAVGGRLNGGALKGAAGNGGAVLDPAAERGMASFVDEYQLEYDSRKRTGFDPMFDDPRPRMPPEVERAGLALGSGSSIGDGGAYASRIYLNQWYVVGPFEPQGERPLDARYAPEAGVDLDAVYAGKNGRTLHWQWVRSPYYPFVPPSPSERSVYYGYTEIAVERPTDVWAWIGADDDAKVWVNDRLVWNGGDDRKAWFHADVKDLEPYRRDYNLSEGKRLIHLEAGRNRILFKLANGMEALFFSMVLSR